MPNSQVSVRPLLLVGADVSRRYSDFLQHLMAGFLNDSIPFHVVVDYNADRYFLSKVPVEYSLYPEIRSFLFGRLNRRRLASKVADFAPTIIHCLSPEMISVANFLSETLNVPHALSFYSLPRGLRKHRLSEDYCGHIGAGSAVIEASLTTSYPEFADRVSRISAGAFTEDRIRCYSREGYLPSMVVAHPLDNCHEYEPLINALRNLAAGGCDFSVVIVGCGRSELKIRSMVRNLGLSGIVNVVGKVRPLRNVFCGADILIAPARVEDFNPVLMEAMSVGLAVASARSNDKLLVDGQTAVFFESTDEKGIFNSLKKLLDEPDFARSIAENGRLMVRENFSVSRMIDKTMQMYRDAIGWFSGEDC